MRYKIVEYTCISCKHRFEKLVENLVKLVPCKKCQEPAFKMLSSPNTKFEGSGFYHTDYRKKDKSFQTKQKINN